MRLLISLLLLLGLPSLLPAQIRVYFNRSVDHTVASSPQNLAEGNVDFSAIAVARIDSARRSVDVAAYNLNLYNVTDALIAAHRRGVAVRVIGHVENVERTGSQFRRLADSGIALFSNPRAPDGERQPLMHHKFFLIDARSGAPDGLHPILLTGSWNPTLNQTYEDPNNLVEIHDSAVAVAYLREFREMWGGDGDDPDPASARFGPGKLNDTDHDFLLDNGIRLEVHFSPSDNTAAEIDSALATGERAIYTANLTFTYESFAITMRHQAVQSGADVRSIVDNVSDQGSRFALLQTFAEAYDWRQSGQFHHKYGLIDAGTADGGSDPQVVTGSHNWTVSAQTYNDENTLILHDAALANQYLQEFSERYREVGGTRAFGSSTVVADNAGQSFAKPGLRVRPNPAENVMHVEVLGAALTDDRLVLYDVSGGKTLDLRIGNRREFSVDRMSLGAGVSLLVLMRHNTIQDVVRVIGR